MFMSCLEQIVANVAVHHRLNSIAEPLKLRVVKHTSRAIETTLLLKSIQKTVKEFFVEELWCA